MVSAPAAVHVALLPCCPNTLLPCLPDALLPCRPAAERARRVYLFVSNTSR